MKKISSVVFVIAAMALLGGCNLFKEPRNAGCTKILMIGNSFSVCLMNHMPKAAADRGVDLDIASLYIGGCSLKRHWENVLKDGDKKFRPYALWRNIKGVSEHSKANLCDVLRMEKWDIITIQQASHDSWRADTYSDYGDKLVEKVRELAPTAQIYVQETWSYTPFDKRLQRWGITADQMYAELHSVYAAFAKEHNLKVIPFGTAVQEWRKRLPVKYTDHSFGGDVVGGGKQDVRDQFKRDANNEWAPACDVFHLSPAGEYFQAIVWLKTLFDVDIDDIDYRPSFVSEREQKLMFEIANDVNAGTSNGGR